jgi:hypothetical protein
VSGFSRIAIAIRREAYSSGRSGSTPWKNGLSSLFSRNRAAT